MIHRHEILIQWGDCDPAGIVYFPRYFEYGDASTSALFASVGLPKPGLFKTYDLAGLPLVDAHANFKIPSRFGDTLTVESRITAWGRSSFSVLHRFFRGEQLALEISEKRVWTVRSGAGGQHSIQSAIIPQEIKDKLPAMPASSTPL